MRSNHSRMSAARAFGLTVVGMVGSLTALDVLVFQGQVRQLLQTAALLWSPGFMFLGTQVLVVGVALFAFALSRRGGAEEDEVELTLDRLEALVEKSSGVGAGSSGVLPFDIDVLRGLRSPRRLSRVHVVAAVEGVVVLLLYGWLVEEFGANRFMRNWVLERVGWAGYVLNFVSVALLAGAFVGIITSQLVSAVRARRRARLKPY